MSVTFCAVQNWIQRLKLAVAQLYNYITTTTGTDLDKCTQNFQVK